MTARTRLAVVLLASALALGALPLVRAATGYTLIGWNDLGMHCMDGDYTVFSILPPYNTIHAQLVDPQGNLVTAQGSFTVTYEAVADADRSINTSSIDKTRFWDFVLDLFGASPAPDTGLAGFKMPGAANTPQAMRFDAAQQWFSAEGIPITPYDDAGHKNPYPMMRLTARDGSGVVLATTDIVLPVSDEMDCSACHASGSASDARPSGGWANHPDPQVDYRLNILLLHDERRDNRTLYQQTLAAAGYSALGLYDQSHNQGKPVLCAACHPSNALPGTGQPGMRQLTHSVHSVHDNVIDPTTGMTLGNSANRSACYRCHPGSTTRCLRGAMGKAVAQDGSMAMQCQSCHGSMSEVGSLARQGWLDQPACQNCHSGTAMKNGGAIRFTSAFTSAGVRRQPADPVFATNAGAPAPGYSLYRFSYGHGGLACEACHGSTHAEYASSHANDNVQSEQLQGHAGVIAECAVCHAQVPNTTSGGPHGMHPIGDAWIRRHGGVAEDGNAGSCRACHGTDYRGTVLSYALGDRQFSTPFGTKVFWRGSQIGCYACHRGPSSESKNSNRPPQAQSQSVKVAQAGQTSLTLAATDPDRDALTYRIVSQPQHGTVGLSGTTATFFAEPGYEGADGFTFAAWDGQIDSNLATVSVAISNAPCQVTCSATVPAAAAEGQSVAFAGTVGGIGCSGTPAVTWSFGDGQTAAQASASHAYTFSGDYGWRLSASADGNTCEQSGTISITAVPPAITGVRAGGKSFSLTISGSNFQPTAVVSIAGQPWANVSWTSATQLKVTGGNALKGLFPKNAWVPITVTNPHDGLSVTVEFNRKTKRIRAVAG